MSKEDTRSKEDEIILIGLPPEWREGVEQVLESKGKHVIYIDGSTRERPAESDDEFIRFAEETYAILTGQSESHDEDL